MGAQNHGMWLGSYEADKQIAIAKILRQGMTFFDIGANAGFYTLLGARRVGPSGRVVAVEPLPRNVEILERHLVLNGISNVHVVGKALSDFVGTARFAVDGHSMSRISAQGRTTVGVTTLDALVEEIGVPPDLLKVDVEGAEMDLLNGAKEILSKYRPVIFLALHSKEIFDRLVETAPEWSYEVREMDGAELRGVNFREEVVLFPEESRA